MLMRDSPKIAARPQIIDMTDPSVLTYTLPAAKKQAQPQLPCYVPPEPDMQHMDSSAATFPSQGARYAEMSLLCFQAWPAHGSPTMQS